MGNTVWIDPISRIEGHLSIKLDVENGKVKSAECVGDMFRGYEKILRGRNPVDANQITQRICGVCPVSHGIASSKSLDMAFDIHKKINDNGRILRNLVLAANYMHSHLIHFYHLAALDFVDITALTRYKGGDSGLLRLKSWVESELALAKEKKDTIAPGGPFLPRYEGKDMYIKNDDINIDAIAGYVKALDIRRLAHQAVALFGGRAPHRIGLVPGGVTQVPTRDKIREYRSIVKEVEKFVNKTYINHVIAVAKAFPDYFSIGKFGNFLSYGLFDQDNKEEKFMLDRGVVVDLKYEKFDDNLINEHVKYARYSSGTQLHPYKGETEPDTHKGYTWLKAPRYRGLGMETGPLARVVVAYANKNQTVQKEVHDLLSVFKKTPKDIGLVCSTLGRHAARAIELKLICQNVKEWLDKLEVGGKPRTEYSIPEEGQGRGLVEASRGALGHWIVVKDKKIANYQAVVPTTWFCGPRDDNGVAGPVEQALVGTPIKDVKNPIEAARVVRSFDPCIACAVHVMEGDKEIGKYRVC